MTRDLVVAVGTDGSKRMAIAVVPSQVRIPVWMERPGLLRAGTEVRPVFWDPCGSMIAEVEIPGAEALGLPATVTVPIAPPGLFARPSVPAAGSPGPIGGASREPPGPAGF